MSVIWEKGVVSFRLPVSPCFTFVCYCFCFFLNDIISMLIFIAPTQHSFFSLFTSGFGKNGPLSFCRGHKLDCSENIQHLSSEGKQSYCHQSAKQQRFNVKTWVPFPAQLDIFLPYVGLKSLTPWINEVTASVSFRVDFNFSLRFTVD